MNNNILPKVCEKTDPHIINIMRKCIPYGECYQPSYEKCEKRQKL